MRIKHENLIRDALYNLHPNSGASPEYARGIIVGAVSVVMAVEGCSFSAAVDLIMPFVPKSIGKNSLPETWVNDFSK